MDDHWMVVWKRETDPVYVFHFSGPEAEKDAVNKYDKIRDSWSEVWLTHVVSGPVK